MSEIGNDLIEAMSEAVAYMGGNPSNTVAHEVRVLDAVDVAEITNVDSPEGRRFDALIDAVVEYEKRRWVIDPDG